MNWYQLTSGRYAGKTLPQVVLINPDWFFSSYENGDFDSPPQLKRDADDVADKARRIRIRNNYNNTYRVEYSIHYPSIRFVRVDIIPTSQSFHRGSTPTLWKNVFDLKIPQIISPPKDVFGGRLLANMVRSHVFPSGVKMSRQVCEAFFDDPSNFDTAQPTIAAPYPCTGLHTRTKLSPGVQRAHAALYRAEKY